MLRHLADAWLVIVLSLGFGGALAGVHVSLGERIRLNQLNETLSQIPQLVPGSAGGEAFGEAGGRPVFKALDGSGQTKGYVIQARGQGFADVIQVLIGVDAEARQITGLYVLEQKETPGLGNKITEPAWCAQFKDKPAEALEAVKGNPAAPNQVRAVTGATISSVSVCQIVNDAVKALKVRRTEGKQ
jgi:electron transport complex protein RnfG